MESIRSAYHTILSLRRDDTRREVAKRWGPGEVSQEDATLRGCFRRFFRHFFYNGRQGGTYQDTLYLRPVAVLSSPAKRMPAPNILGVYHPPTICRFEHDEAQQNRLRWLSGILPIDAYSTRKKETADWRRTVNMHH